MHLQDHTFHHSDDFLACRLQNKHAIINLQNYVQTYSWKQPCYSLFKHTAYKCMNDTESLRNMMELLVISVHLLMFYQECHSLIGYATQYLFCDIDSE